MGRILGIAALLVLASSSAYLWGVHQGKSVGPVDVPDTSFPEAPRMVAAQGKLVPRRGLLTLGATPGDQIEKVLVQVGDPVSPGQPLIRMKSHRVRQLELELAESRLEEARKRIEIEQQVADSKWTAAKFSVSEAELKRQELDQQQANLDLLEKQLSQQEKQLERLQDLSADPVTTDVVSEADIEKQTLLVEKLQSDMAQGQAALSSARQGYELAVQAAEAQLSAAKFGAESVKLASPLVALQKAVDLAQLNLNNSTIHAPEVSPADGDTLDLRVLRMLANEGDQVGNMPLVQLGDVSEMVCVAEVYEGNLALVRLAQPATISSAALAEPLRGTVVEIGKVIGRPSLPNPNPLSRQDIRTAEITILLDSESAAQAAELINLQVDVELPRDDDNDAKDEGGAKDEGDAEVDAEDDAEDEDSSPNQVGLTADQAESSAE